MDDLTTLPDLPPHTELIDGSLVFVSPQRRFHARMIDVLVRGVGATLPHTMDVEREMTVLLDRRNAPEPDVLVVRADSTADLDMEQTRFMASDVLLAVEVVSPDSEARARHTKPRKYAAAGIPNFWLVEMAGADSHPVVRVYELDPVSGTHAVTGIHHGQLKVSVPFTIDIDVSKEALRNR
ncbi:Uma2 family endonuclease [Streptomyces axinellae]|uniref:Uma2 family endonuclease n=1 Tax=Streptomyces axinellae TaxID=552788 RepID=A0ABP6CMX1_9ACTN